MARRQQAPSVPITSEERAQFSFLFDWLAPNDRSNLEEILDRLKGAGRVDLNNLDRLKPNGAAPVSPDNLSALLLCQLALDMSNLVRAREAWEAWVEDLARFAKALKPLQMKGAALLHPPAFLGLLGALSLALHEESQMAHRIVAHLSARASKRRPRREMVALPPGIGRDDARELRRLTRLAARNAPPAAWTITHHVPPPCPQCGNPVPQLFRRK